MHASSALNQSDFDLDKFINMFDQALTSSDPRVLDALRSLLVIVTLTKSQSIKEQQGPVGKLFHSHQSILRRLNELEQQVHHLKNKLPADLYQYHGSNIVPMELPNEPFIIGIDT